MHTLYVRHQYLFFWRIQTHYYNSNSTPLHADNCKKWIGHLKGFVLLLSIVLKTFSDVQMWYHTLACKARRFSLYAQDVLASWQKTHALLYYSPLVSQRQSGFTHLFFEKIIKLFDLKSNLISNQLLHCNC